MRDPVTMMRQLPDRARLQLLARINAAGIATREGDESTDYNCGFHGDGVVFCRGVLRWCGSSPVDSVIHEAAHALMLPIEKRKTWRDDDLDPAGRDEQPVMERQVELCRGIRGVGIYRALGWMEEIGYTFDPAGYDVGARVWWRTTLAERHRSPAPEGGR